MIPETIEREYDVVRCLSEMREGRCVWLVRDKITGRDVVLKMGDVHTGDIENEYRMLTSMAGAGVPACYRYMEEEGTAFLLREYVWGETLSAYAARRGGLNAQEVERIGCALCAILRRFHENEPPVIHRDLKPENVVRREGGDLVLIDLGIARCYSAEAVQDTQVLGTPAVAPPEQYGFGQTDARSDVFSLGRLLQRISAAPTDRALSRVLERCTRFDPSARYRDAGQLLQALRGLHVRKRHMRALSAFACVLALVFAGLGLSRAAQTASKQPVDAPKRSVQPVAGRATPRPARTPVIHEDGSYTFASAGIERAVRAQLGRETGAITLDDLKKIDTLMLCGEVLVDDYERISVFGSQVGYDGRIVSSYGDVNTLADIAYMKNLHTLALCNQMIDDLSPLAGMNIRHLALHGNRITDVTPLASCTQLVKLTISNNPVRNLSALAACEQLWYLNASTTYLRDLSTLTGIKKLNMLSVMDCELLGDLSAAEQMKQLEVLQLRPVSRAQLDTVVRLSQLVDLYMWQVQGLKDFTPLSGMKGLRMLYLYEPGMRSLAGIEGMQSLAHLDLTGTDVRDLTPLAGAQRLARLSLGGMAPESWSPLRDMPNLQIVHCQRDQMEAVRALGLDIAVYEAQ